MPKWLEILKQLGPMVVATVVPGGAILAPIIVGAIAEAETIKGATGAQKKAAALNLVKAGAAGANAVAGKQVIDPAKAVAAAESGIDTVVSVVNIAHDAATTDGQAGGPIVPPTP